jgi:hypothetical protein
VAQAGTTQAEVGVEPWVLPAGADMDVGGKPIAAADAGAGEAGRCGDDDTPSGISEEHYQTELPKPFLFLVSLWVWITSSAMMTLLMNSENDPLVLSVMHSCSFVERPFMKRFFFFSTLST